ncbi:MAG: hypothetical protein ACREYF_28635 [Gammaproteobacteria bacterium]
MASRTVDSANRYCDVETIDFTRSEPGRKTTIYIVEERNGDMVRKYLGYVRLDCPDMVPVMNELDALALYLNHTHAVQRTLTQGAGGRKVSAHVRKDSSNALPAYVGIRCRAGRGDE